ncbi:MAG: hypothetical protein QMD06_05280 [Candidatus Altarchaeum sp.]|nr:hypothetical protein [Candidatus Altarchaeum sp.]
MNSLIILRTFKPAISPASFVTWRCVSIKYAGTLIIASVNFLPVNFFASPISFFTMCADIYSGVNFSSSISTAYSVPICLFIDLIVLSAFTTMFCFANLPTTPPSFLK